MQISQITFNYRSWLYEPVGLVFRDPSGGVHQFPSPKRGNDAYMRRVLKKYIPIEMYLENFNYGYGKTAFMFITLTYNPKKYTLDELWNNVSKDYNLFSNKFRRIFGKNLEIIRCYEAHQSGYPHIHLLVRHPYNLFNYFVKNRKYRIDSNICVSMIKSMWKHGFSDIQACINGHYAAEYVLKYITKTSPRDFDGNKSKALINYAILWHYHKKSFAVAKRVRDLIRGLLPISNLLSHPKWSFLGINTQSGYIPKEYFHMKIKRKFEHEDMLKHSLFIQNFKISAKLLYPWWLDVTGRRCFGSS